MSNIIVRGANRLQDLIEGFKAIDFLAPLALRLYLAPIFWLAGTKKLEDIDSVAAWFGNPDWGLGLPYPEFMAWAAALTEAGGAILLVAGLAVRWIAVPLMVTMVVAAYTVHWQSGWQAIHDLSSPWPSANAEEALRRLDISKERLKECCNYDWLTEHGKLVSLNNGIEFAATYFIMCLALFFSGAGKYFSIDHWIRVTMRDRD